MKTRKSGAMWGVVLTLVIGLAFFLNATNFLTKPLLPEAPKQAENKPSISQNDTKTQLANQVRSRRGGQEGEDMPTDGIPEKTALFKPKQQTYVPQYNETSTSSQWDNDENIVKQKAEEVKEERGF
ncbi:hypothetical protein C0431_01755 [bacterium]|jgi:hypothetical protein|nr:hypothetical protein [bacterium]